MISQVSMSRDRSTLWPRCSLGPSITRPIPWSILRLRPLAAGVTCRCTAAGNYRVVCGLLIVFLVGFGRPIHTSGSGAHCVWWSWRNGGLSWLLLSWAVMGEVEVLSFFSYTEWRRWHTWSEHWYLLHCERILMQYTGPLEEFFY